MSLGDLVAVETKEQTREHFDKIIEQKYDVFETQYRAKNGRLLDLEVRGTYLEGMGDFVIFLSDIGERKKMLAQEKTALIEAEASLQRAIKAEKQQLQAYEETRRHLGRELHDNIGQQITAVALLSDILAKDLIKEVNPLYESAKKITTRLNHALSRIRQLSHGFYQNTFDHDSLIDRLKSLASETTSIHGIGCTFHYDKTSRVKDYFGYGDTPAEECHLQLFRIAQEAVTNAVRHSGASQIELSLRHSSKGDILSITDNGIGISTKNHSSGLGMYSMAFRAKLMKADIVFNTLKTGGTCVSICMARDRKRY
jgi:signal transduction histidine kinase